MAYVQLIAPDTSVTEAPGYCLGMATKVFFGSQGGYGCATDAWNASPTQNPSRDMPNVAVPVWFSWWGQLDVYKDWGHVVVYIPGSGFLSSPGRWSDPVGQQWFGSIEEIERWFGCTYNGFTLDIMPNGTVAQWVDGPAPEPTPTPSGTTVTVQPWPSQMSTLWGISEATLGDGGRWPEIYQANIGTIGSDPNLIQPGMVLTIPGA